MAVSQDTYARGAFKPIQGVSNIGSGAEYFNEAYPSRVPMAAPDIYVDTIPSTAGAVAGVILDCTGANALNMRIIGASNGLAYQAVVPSAGHPLVTGGYTNPFTNSPFVAYDDGNPDHNAQQASFVGDIIPKRYDSTPGDSSYRAILLDGATERAPTIAENWYLDTVSGIVVSELALNLATNGTLECYVYVGRRKGVTGLSADAGANFMVGDVELIEGTNITLTQDLGLKTITVDASGGAGGESNTGDNVGVGTGEVYSGMNGTVLEFHTLLEGTGIDITTGTNEVTIAALPDAILAASSFVKLFDTPVDYSTADDKILVVDEFAPIEKLTYTTFTATEVDTAITHSGITGNPHSTNLWLTVSADLGSSLTADVPTDQLRIQGEVGGGISTQTIGDDTVEISLNVAIWGILFTPDNGTLIIPDAVTTNWTIKGDDTSGVKVFGNNTTKTVTVDATGVVGSGGLSGTGDANNMTVWNVTDTSLRDVDLAVTEAAGLVTFDSTNSVTFDMRDATFSRAFKIDNSTYAGGSTGTLLQISRPAGWSGGLVRNTVDGTLVLDSVLGLQELPTGGGASQILEYTGTVWQFIDTPAGGSGDPDQFLWETVSANVGDIIADSATDQLFILGTGNISTATVGDNTVQISTTGQPDQNLWATVTGVQGGSTTANTTTDTLSVTGLNGISCTVVGDQLRVDGAGVAAATTFLGLSDVDPGTYVGQDNKIVKVNSGPADGLEFGALFTHLEDVDMTTVAPTINQIPKWNGSAWAPADDEVGTGTVPAGQSKRMIRYSTDGSTIDDVNPVQIEYIAGSEVRWVCDNVDISFETNAANPFEYIDTANFSTSTPLRMQAFAAGGDLGRHYAIQTVGNFADLLIEAITSDVLLGNSAHRWPNGNPPVGGDGGYLYCSAPSGLGQEGIQLEWQEVVGTGGVDELSELIDVDTPDNDDGSYNGDEFLQFNDTSNLWERRTSPVIGNGEEVTFATGARMNTIAGQPGWVFADADQRFQINNLQATPDGGVTWRDGVAGGASFQIRGPFDYSFPFDNQVYTWPNTAPPDDGYRYALVASSGNKGFFWCQTQCGQTRTISIGSTQPGTAQQAVQISPDTEGFNTPDVDIDMIPLGIADFFVRREIDGKPMMVVRGQAGYEGHLEVSSTVRTIGEQGTGETQLPDTKTVVLAAQSEDEDNVALQLSHKGAGGILLGVQKGGTADQTPMMSLVCTDAFHNQGVEWRFNDDASTDIKAYVVGDGDAGFDFITKGTGKALKVDGDEVVRIDSVSNISKPFAKYAIDEIVDNDDDTCINIVNGSATGAEAMRFSSTTNNVTIEPTSGNVAVNFGSLGTGNLNLAGGTVAQINATNVRLQGITYPAADGTPGQPITTNGSGALSFGGLNMDAINNFFNGSVIETIDIDIVSDGVTVSLELEQSGGGDLTFIYGGEQYTLDCTPASSVNLTAGTDAAPVQNYVYVTESGGTLTLVASTSDWPATAHAPVATVVVQSASGVQTDGSYKVHAWTDHLYKSTENGHLSHLNRKIRAQPATWLSGCSASDIATNQINVATGVVYQLHPHSFPALDMGTGDPLFVWNDPDSAYTRLTSLSGVDKLSDGSSIGNNKYVNLVLWGVVSEKDQDCQLFLNVPSGEYNNVTDATQDIDSTSNYGIPDDFVGCGFLIARYVTQWRTAAGGSHTQQSKVDLRGLLPSVAAGGVGGSGASAFTQLDDTPATFVGSGLDLVRVNTGETALEFFTAPYMESVVEDLGPQLGGDLDANGFNIGFNDNTGITDDTSVYQLRFQKTNFASVYWEMTNAVSGQSPTLSVNGTDPDINAVIKPKGEYSVILADEDDNSVIEAQGAGATSTNYLKVLSSTTGNPVQIQSQGGDTSPDIDVTPKALGRLMYNGTEVSVEGHTHSYLANIVEDTTPQLGGDLDTNSRNIKFDTNHGIRDDSNNEQLIFGKTASATQYLKITNATASNDPILETTRGLTLMMDAGNEFGITNIDDEVIFKAFDNEGSGSHVRIDGNQTTPKISPAGVTNADLEIAGAGTGKLNVTTPLDMGSLNKIDFTTLLSFRSSGTDVFYVGSSGFTFPSGKYGKGTWRHDGDPGAGVAGTVIFTDVEGTDGTVNNYPQPPSGYTTRRWVKTYVGTKVGYTCVWCSS